jgi:hypothetical protein
VYLLVYSCRRSRLFCAMKWPKKTAQGFGPGKAYPCDPPTGATDPCEGVPARGHLVAIGVVLYEQTSQRVIPLPPFSSFVPMSLNYGGQAGRILNPRSPRAKALGVCRI